MSIFSAIKNAIFGGPASAAEVSPTNPADPMPSNMPPAASATTGAASATSAAAKGAASKVDVAAILDKLDDSSDEDLDWRKSIVDLMKLLKIDSSLTARKQLAQELKYTGDMSDSASMNVWLHKQVMTKLAENGGVVPAELKH